MLLADILNTRKIEIELTNRISMLNPNQSKFQVYANVYMYGLNLFRPIVILYIFSCK